MMRICMRVKMVEEEQDDDEENAEEKEQDDDKEINEKYLKKYRERLSNSKRATIFNQIFLKLLQC